MTSDEAISIMNVIVHMLEPQYDTDRIEDAIEMAIKALEQDPCDDCINRKSVNDLVRELGNILNGTERRRDVSTVLTDILYLPSVTPQPKMGKWIYRKEEDLYRCSLCSFPCHKDNMGAIPTRYCAECGAKMQEVEE